MSRYAIQETETAFEVIDTFKGTVIATCTFEKDAKLVRLALNSFMTPEQDEDEWTAQMFGITLDEYRYQRSVDRLSSPQPVDEQDELPF